LDSTENIMANSTADTNGMLEIPCPLCSGTSYRMLYNARLGDLEASFDYLTETPSNFRVVRCLDCRMVYSSPVFSEEKFLSLYRDSRIDKAIEDIDLHAIRINMRRYLDRLIRISGMNGGSLLDVGCGCGHLLEYASSLGFKVHGVDPSLEAVNHARELLGVDTILTGSYQRTLYPSGSFDLVLLIHVIDHVISPKDLLKTVHYHLKPGGYVFIVTHNIASLLSRLTGENFIAYSVQHISYFNPDSLRKMLASCNLDFVQGMKSVTTYPLCHYVENGISNPVWRNRLIRLLSVLGLAQVNFSFPFGNIEVIGRKGSA